MDTAIENQNGKFAKLVKRIWNGPEDLENEDFEEKSLNEIKQERKKDMSYNSHSNYPQTEEPAQPGFTAPQPQRYTAPQDPRQAEPENTTVISRGTVITGDIKSDGNIEMLGAVTGNITTAGNVKINGKQTGDVQGTSIDLYACTVRGTLNAAEDVNVDSDSMIVGDIKCGNLAIDGKLKGNIHVMGNVSCQGNSVILGDITATTISISNGAKLRGKLEVSDGSIDQVELPDAGAPIPSPSL